MTGKAGSSVCVSSLQVGGYIMYQTTTIQQKYREDERKTLKKITSDPVIYLVDIDPMVMLILQNTCLFMLL